MPQSTRNQSAVWPGELAKEELHDGRISFSPVVRRLVLPWSIEPPFIKIQLIRTTIDKKIRLLFLWQRFYQSLHQKESKTKKFHYPFNGLTS